MTIKLRVAHLYPRLMNIYGDRGNIMCLRHRCEARGIAFELTELGLRDRFEPLAHDLIFAGGAQDREQRGVVDDLLATKADAVREAVESDVAMLAVCGAYQLFGRLYREASGAELPGIGIFDLHTEHPGVGAKRLIGNIVAEWEPSPRPVSAATLRSAPPLPQGERGLETNKGFESAAPGPAVQTIVGFENHGGRTRLGPEVQPLARVRHGFGNNGEDGTEGAVYRNAIGSYVHGSLLPKNPVLADHVISLALRRVHGDVELAAIDDRAEERAHAAALRLR